MLPHPSHPTPPNVSQIPPLLSVPDIQIMKRPDGSLWRLGAGGFGTVFKALLHGVQPVAVKVCNCGMVLHYVGHQLVHGR